MPFLLTIDELQLAIGDESPHVRLHFRSLTSPPHLKELQEKEKQAWPIVSLLFHACRLVWRFPLLFEFLWSAGSLECSECSPGADRLLNIDELALRVLHQLLDDRVEDVLHGGVLDRIVGA